MAILIPSKNIYDIENPKIRDNAIDKVSVEQTVVTPSNDYETLIKQIEREEFVDGEKETSARIKYAYGGSVSGVSSYYALSASYLSVSTKYTNNISIEIKKLLKNAYISKIYDGKNSKDEDNIKFTVYQKVRKFNVSMTINHDYIQGEIDFTPSKVNEEITPIVNTNGTNSIPSEYIDTDNNSIKISQTTTAIAPSGASVNASISNSISVTNQQNISNKKFYTVDDNFRIDGLIFLSGIVVTKMKYEFAEGGSMASSPPATITLTGTREYYIPEEIEISIYGDTIGIDLTNGSITYGSGNKPFSLSGNELLQDSAKVGDKVLTEYLANNVLTQYAKGKETATLLCSISNYYDENGNKVIDTTTEKMAFSLHDWVVPMVYGADGQDHAMSKSNGLAKVFEVIGSNIIYDGAVWQELFLQELGETQDSPSIPEIPETPEIPDTPDIPDTPEQTQLLAPTISISGNTLLITDNSGLAKNFDILVDGVVKGSVEVEQEETYTLSGTWLFNRVPHSLDYSFIGQDTVNYLSINFTSNGNNYTKMGFVQGDDLGVDFCTWLYYDNTVAFNGAYNTAGWTNEIYRTITFDGEQTVSKDFYDWFTANAVRQETTYTIKAGTYVFNEELDFTNISADINESFTFTPTNGYKSNLIDITVNPVPVIIYYEGVSDGYNVYNAGWLDEDYRTITIETDQSVSADFYNWFNTNTLITFTIAGTPYQAENGMTWSEWVNSSYNTLGLVNAGHEINNDGTTNYKNLKYTDTTIVNPSDTIIVNYAYILSGGSGA